MTEQLPKKTYPKLIINFLWASLRIGISYDFSYKTVLIGVISKTLIDENINSSGYNETSLTPTSTYNPEETSVSASTVIMPYVNLATIAFLGPIFAININLSQYLGELIHKKSSETQKNIETISRDGLVLSLGLCLFSAALLLPSNSILNALDQPSEESYIASQYLQIYTIAVPALYLRTWAEQLLFSLGKEHITAATLLSLAGLTISVSLGICMTIGAAFPKMGLNGLAIGYVIGDYFVAFAYITYLSRKKNIQNLRLLNFNNLKKVPFSKITLLLSDGWPISLSLFIEALIPLAFCFIAGKMGSEELTMMNSLISSYFAIFIFSVSSGQANYQKIRVAIGQSSYKLANKLAHTGIRAVSLVTAPICAISALITIYTNPNFSEEFIPLSITFSAAVFIHVINYNIAQQQRSFFDNIWPTTVSAFGYLVIGVTFSALTGILTDLNVKALGIGYLIGAISVFTPSIIRWANKINPKEIQKEHAKNLSKSNSSKPSLKLSWIKSTTAGIELQPSSIDASTPPLII